MCSLKNRQRSELRPCRHGASTHPTHTQAHQRTDHRRQEQRKPAAGREGWGTGTAALASTQCSRWRLERSPPLPDPPVRKDAVDPAGNETGWGSTVGSITDVHSTGPQQAVAGTSTCSPPESIALPAPHPTPYQGTAASQSPATMRRCEVQVEGKGVRRVARQALKSACISSTRSTHDAQSLRQCARVRARAWPGLVRSRQGGVRAGARAPGSAGPRMLQVLRTRAWPQPRPPARCAVPCLLSLVPNRGTPTEAHTRALTCRRGSSAPCAAP